MTAEVKRVKVDSDTSLISVLHEVRESDEPIEIEMDGFAYVVSPARAGWDRPTEEQIEATKSSFGSWKDLVDGDELKRRIIEERGSDRPFNPL